MADVVDDFGRVTRLKADFESLSESLRSAVNKAVEYAAGRAKDNTDDLKGEFDKLVEAMEELGDDVKESLKSTKDFVEEVKKAAESVEKIKASKASGGKDTLAEAQKEQTRILQMLLRSHQKAVSEKAAKFTSGGTVLSAPSTKRPALKEMGFRPRGADKIPAMVSPGEFVVSKKGARGNEGLLDRINRGYMRGGKVKPEYLAGGTSGNWQGRRFNASMGSGGRAHIVVEGDWSAESERKLREDFAHLGDDISIEFSKKFDNEFKKRVSTWAGSMATAFTGRGDPWQSLFEGAVKDITDFRREMRNLAFQTEGITGNFREAQAEFARIGTDIAGRTGVSVTAFQKAYMNNARKGFKDQKAGMKVLESGLKLSTLIGSESQATASLFADWHRELGMGAVQMERMASNMQMVARNTGVTGDELVEVMKSSDQILKNLRNQGTLTTTAARNITQAMAEFKKQGFGEEGQKMLGAMSGYSAFQGADDGTKTILGIASQVGGVDYRELLFGDVVQDGEKMGQMGQGLQDFMAKTIGVDPKNFNLDLITNEQRRTLSIALEGMGTSLGAAETAIDTFQKSAQGIGGQLSEFEKVTKSATATEKEKQEAEKKMNDMLLSSSMDMLGSVRQVSEKFGDKSMGELSEILQGDNKFAKEFAAGTKDMASMAPHLSDSLRRSFGLSGTAEEMASQIQSMDIGKQMELRGAAAAEQLDKMMAAAGKGDKEFSARMQKAMASGDIKMVKTIGEEMAAAQSELQVGDAAGVDPMEALEQTMNELNETIRSAFSPLTGAVLDLIGWIGLMGIQIGMMGGSLSSLFGGPTGLFSSGGLGKVLVEGPFGAFFKGFSREMSQTGDIFKAFTRGFSGQWKSFSHFVGPSVVQGLKTALGPAFVLLGGIKGVMEADSAKRTKTEGFILGALTGGAKTGSFLSPMLGVEKGSGADKALGIAGAAAYGAAAGFAFGGPAGAFVGAILGGVTEIVKIITEGTDILQDIFAPFQVIVDFVYNRLKNIWDIIAGVFTLDIGRVFKGVFNAILNTALLIPRLILSVFQMVLVGLPKLIFRTLMLIWELPKMFMGAIKSMFESLVDNPWVGPIFKVFSDAFNMIYDGFMAIWQPIADIFSGLYTVFNDLGKALFGTGEGGGFLAGVMWVLQKAVYAVSYVISWLLVPLKLFAWALGFVMKIIGNTIAGIIYPFQYLYDVLVGHSIVPDLVFGIIEFFAMLPLKIFGFLIQIPIMLGKALLNIPVMIGRAFMAAGSVLGSFGEALIRSFKKIPKMFFRGMTAVFYDFPKWLMGGIMDGFWAVGNFLFLTLPKMLWDGFKKTVSDLKKAIWDTLWWPFKKLGEMLQAVFYDFPIWLGTKLMEGLQAIFYDLPMWLGKTIWDGMASIAAGIPGALYGALHSAASAIGLGWLVDKLAGGTASAAGSVSKGFGETADQQEATRLAEGDKISHAIGGLTGAVGSLMKGNLSEAGGKAWSATKEGAAAAWEGTKYVASYLNPFSYFKEGTKKIEKPGLGMLHEGEMVVPKGIVDKIAAVGDGAFGSLSSFLGRKKPEGGGGPISSILSFIRGKMGGSEGAGESVFASLSDRIKGMGDWFKGCCPKESGEVQVRGVSEAVADALKGVDEGSFFGRIKKKFEDAQGYTDSFFKPLTLGFNRARKNGDGFFASITKGLKYQFMSMSHGNEGGVMSRLAGSMDWLSKSIFGEREGKDTKRSILQRIKDGIFGTKEGEETKKGILDVIKNGLFGEGGEGMKKGIFSIMKEGFFGKEGEGGGLMGWLKSKVFGNKVGEGEEGPSKPGLADAAKGTAKSLWESTKRRLEINTEDGMISGVKKAAVGLYGKAKDKILGEKMAEGEMGPARPGLLTKAKSKAVGLYGKAKDKILGKSPTEAVKSAASADAKAPGKLENFKEKMKNIAEGIKEFSGTKVLAGALNLIPSSVGLVAMIPGSLGIRMLSAIDGKTIQSSLEGLGKGVSALGEGKVLMGAAAMLAVGVASIGLIPAIPILAVLGLVGPLVRKGLLALGKGLSAFGKAAANPYTWLGVALLAALNVAMIPLAYAISLLSPAIEAFGKAIKMAFEGAGSMLRAVGESIGMILKEITISKALALGVAALGITALGAAMVAFAGGSFIADWISYFGGDGVFKKIMEFAAMASSLMVAANAVDMLGKAMGTFASNKGGGWAEWFAGSDGVIEGFKELSKIGTPEFVATAEAVHKMGEGMEKMHAIPMVSPMPGDATTATTPIGEAAPVPGSPSVGVEPVHLRDITGTILRDRVGSEGNKLQSDELSRMEEASNRQVSELEQIRQGIQELVSLMRPRGGTVGDSGELGKGNTKDPRRPMHAARFGKMKFGVPGGLANRSVVNTGEV